MINDFRGQYRWLSNFHVIDIEYEGIIYPSTEHAYQAAKTNDLNLREAMASLSRPFYAKKIGSLLPIRSDWESDLNWPDDGGVVTRVKDKVMLDVCTFKFHDEELADKLLATGSEELVEGNNWGDTYWGVCDGKGQNKLGKILMKIRERLRVGRILDEMIAHDEELGLYD